MESISLMLSVLFSGLGLMSFDSPIVVNNGQLKIEVNNDMQTKITNLSVGADQLMSDFANSEYLITDLFTADRFKLSDHKEENISSASGEGTQWTFTGDYTSYPLQKIVKISVYKDFPNTAYFQVQYINKGDKILMLRKWINNHYEIIPSQRDTVRFWSFQGSTHADRRDWIQRVNPGLNHKNFMGMNASDYGGGIPLLDIWRRDGGIAIGMSDNIFRLVSLPVDYGRYSPTAKINVEYEYQNGEALRPNSTFDTYETFVSVHTGDCFPTLQTYSKYLQAKGVKPAEIEPEAYETMWCAWGYGRNFTVEEILKTLPKVKELGIKWVGLDDGFFPEIGDWYTTSAKFPRGDADMKAFVDSIHSYGLKAMLWWNPMAVSPKSKFLADNPNILLVQKNGAPQYVTWWDSFYPSPTDTKVRESAARDIERFIKEWGFDGLKLDGQNQNLCSPDYARRHNITNPDEAFEQLPDFFADILKNTRKIKPDAVVQICPCGTVMNFFLMPQTNQFVSSDPKNAWQVRTRALVYRALMPETAFYGDHVELIRDDFASQFGVGAVLGTKFVWPDMGSARDKRLLLTPEKDKLFGKWFALYNKMMLSKGDYLGDLYDIGYDYPETHVIKKGRGMYYSFFNPDFSGNIMLKGLDTNKKYIVKDYFNDVILGTISGSNPQIKVDFQNFLMLEAVQE